MKFLGNLGAWLASIHLSLFLRLCAGVGEGRESIKGPSLEWEFSSLGVAPSRIDHRRIVLGWFQAVESGGERSFPGGCPGEEESTQSCALCDSRGCHPEEL